jgi:hypothetical protein
MSVYLFSMSEAENIRANLLLWIWDFCARVAVLVRELQERKESSD